MKDQVIKFKALNQSLRKTSGFSTYPNGMVGIITAEFELGDGWDGYDSVRAVWQNGEVKISSFLDSNYKCKIPSEVLENKGTLEVNLVASSVDDDVLTERLTSYKVVAFQIPVKVNIDGSDPQDVTPSQFEQFVAVVKEDADRAEAGATDAEASAQSASGSATASANSATASATSAGESEQSKTQAQEYAQNAYNLAVGAESAKDDAEDARDEIRSMRAEAVTLSPGSDATASYSDGLLSLGIPRGDPGEVSAEQLNTALATKADAIISSASGSIASIPDGAEAPVKKLTVGIEPVQDGTGDPSPGNMRPISGWTGVNVTRTGKNLSSVNELADRGPQWGDDQSPIKAMINTLPVGTYTLSNKYEILEMPSSGKVVHGTIYVTAIINRKQQPVNRYATVLDNSPYLGKVYEEQAVITITEENKGKINHTYTYCDQYPSHTGSGRGKYRVFDIQIELGSTATDYEPYQGETYEVEFPSEAGTVYGGSLDVTTGVLTVDRAMVDLGTLSWYAHQSYGFYTVDIRNLVKSPSGNAYPVDAMCSQYKVVPQSAELATDASLAVDTTGILYVNDKRYSDATAFKTAVSGVQLAFSITTPITYPLTAHQIKSLYGDNNIWADAGDTSVTYKADTKLYIDKKFTELQALILEN